MFKTISAALLAASVLAAPAMAAGTAKTTHSREIKASVRNAHAEMGYRHDRHHHHNHKLKRIVRDLIHRS